jgi:hypothetical protein
LELELQVFLPPKLSGSQATRATSTSLLKRKVTIQLYSDLPYDRSLLSKGMSGKGPASIRSEESFDNNGIIVLR